MLAPNSSSPFLLALCIALAIALITVWMPENYASSDFQNVLIGIIGIVIAGTGVGLAQWWRFNKAQEKEKAEEQKWDTQRGYQKTRAAIELKPITDEQRAAHEAKRRDNERKYFGEAATVLLLIAAAVIALMQWHTLEKTDQTLRAQRRAWIAPEQIVVPDNFQQGKDEDAALGVRFKNTGNEPAFDLNYPIEIDVIEGSHWLDQNFLRRKTLEMLGNRSCDSFDISSKGRTVFPGASGSIRKDLDHERAHRGSTHPGYFVIVVACLVYRTAEAIRRSEFCGVLDHPNRSNDEKRPTVFCPVHNRAN
jgi:hypothetical protein